MIAKFREQDVAHHHCLLTGRRPAGQTKERAPMSLMDNSVADQIVILTMIEHRQVDHARILDGASHYFMTLNAVTVIRYCHHACFCERSDPRDLFTREIF